MTVKVRCLQVPLEFRLGDIPGESVVPSRANDVLVGMENFACTSTLMLFRGALIFRAIFCKIVESTVWKVCALSQTAFSRLTGSFILLDFIICMYMYIVCLTLRLQTHQENKYIRCVDVAHI